MDARPTARAGGTGAARLLASRAAARVLARVLPLGIVYVVDLCVCRSRARLCACVRVCVCMSGVRPVVRRQLRVRLVQAWRRACKALGFARALSAALVSVACRVCVYT